MFFLKTACSEVSPRLEIPAFSYRFRFPCHTHSPWLSITSSKQEERQSLLPENTGHCFLLWSCLQSLSQLEEVHVSRQKGMLLPCLPFSLMGCSLSRGYKALSYWPGKCSASEWSLFINNPYFYLNIKKEKRIHLLCQRMPLCHWDAIQSCLLYLWRILWHCSNP